MRSNILKSNPGIIWLITIPGVLSLIMILVLLVLAIVYRTSYGTETLKYFNSDFLARASEYNRTSLIISIFARMLTWLFMASAVWIGWKYFIRSSSMSVLRAAGYITLFYIVLNVIIIPLSYYRGFTLEHQFGLSNQTTAMWFADFGKEKGIEIILSIGAFTGIYALMVYIPRYWWLIAASIMAVFIVIGVYLYPVLIDPLFYRFEKLDDVKLREEILEITDKADIEIEDILVADASRRTIRANAYFTGLGSTRRIVLYDNLINDFSRDEVLSVVAHEAAHWKYAHIIKNMAISIAGGFIGFFILNIIFYRAGITASMRSIFVLILVISLITFISLPFRNIASRYFEKQADELSLEITGKYDAQISLMIGLAASNLSNVEPHPVIRSILYSHPPIMERILFAEKAKIQY